MYNAQEGCGPSIGKRAGALELRRPLAPEPDVTAYRAKNEYLRSEVDLFRHGYIMFHIQVFINGTFSLTTVSGIGHTLQKTQEMPVLSTYTTNSITILAISTFTFIQRSLAQHAGLLFRLLLLVHSIFIVFSSRIFKLLPLNFSPIIFKLFSYNL